MRISLSLLLVASLGLGACGTVRDSALNPGNWFGRAATAPAPAQPATPVNPLIPQSGGLFANRRNAAEVFLGTPFEEVVSLEIDRVQGGAILRAVGRAAREGRYDVQLTPANEDEAPVDGVLTYRFEGVEAPGAAVGTPATREVVAARRLSNQDLRGVNTIRVEGLRNALVVRR